MKNSKKRIVFIDGHALLHRAYHAYPQTLTTRKGELVNAVYGFTSILFNICRELHPEYVAVAFDLKGPTFRHQEYAGYKASRVKPDEELINQIDRVKQVVKGLNIPIFEVAGFEADDVIGSLATQAFKSQKKSKKLEVIIATGDRDALQLVNGDIKVYLPAKSKQPARLVDGKEFEREWGFKPKHLVDYKALAGDASDDIPGVSGIGPKKATQLIQKFGQIEKLYQALEKHAEIGLSASDRQKLEQGKAQAFLSKKLAQIVTQVPIKLKLKACKLTDYNEETVEQLFDELEFRSLLSRLPGKEKEKRTQPPAASSQKDKEKDTQMELFSS